MREPFRLAEEIGGIGFRTADAAARAQGLPLDDPGRIRAAALHALDQESDQGHCFLFSSHLMQEVAALCYELVIIAHGGIVARGTPDEIRRQSGETDLEEAFVKAVDAAPRAAP